MLRRSVGAILLALVSVGTSTSTAARDQVPVPHGFYVYCRDQPARCERNGSPAAVSMNATRLAELAAVNTSVNRRIKPVPNAAGRWRDDASRGDCKDYALAKRAALLDLGWPAGALRIAIGKTPTGQLHAVLVVATTNRGDLVLDNLRDTILSSGATGYRWEMRSSTDPFVWVRMR